MAVAEHEGVRPPAVAACPRVTIVPVKGLPIVAAVVIGLIAAIAGDWLWALTFFHVAGGGLWMGVDLFVGFIVGPIVGRMSIPARVEFSVHFMPKMLLLMPTLVTMTLASGFQLARHLGYLDPSYPRHAWIVASFIVVGVLAVIALGYLEPANLAVLFELAKPEPNGAVIARLMKRLVYAAGITGAMQVATLIIMTRIRLVTGRRLPPVTEIGVASMICVIVGVIYMAAHIPRRPSLTLPVICVAAAALLFFANAVLLARVRDFAWWRFFQVARWGLLAYLVIAGMIEYAFIYDDTSGSVLVLMTVLLGLFTANVPILLAFTVARYQATRAATAG